MGKSYRDQAHRKSKNLFRKWRDAFNNGGRGQLKEISSELHEANRKSGGSRKKWYQRKHKQEELDNRYDDLSDDVEIL